MRKHDNSTIGETALQGNGSRAVKWKNKTDAKARCSSKGEKS